MEVRCSPRTATRNGSSMRGSDMGGVVISGGRVVDPASGMDATADVALLDGKIAAVGDGGWVARIGSSMRQASWWRPASSTCMPTGQSIPADRMQAFDGVTTTLDLEAGVMPVASWYKRQAEQGRVLNYGASTNWAFARIGAMTGSNEESVARRVRPGHAGPPLGGQRGQRRRSGRHPRPPGTGPGRGWHRHRHPQRLCARCRRAGADRHLPTGLRPQRADLHPRRLHVPDRPGERGRGLYPPDRLCRGHRRAHAHLPLQQLQQDPTSRAAPSSWPRRRRRACR